MTDGLGDLVREQWTSLLAERFTIADENPHRLELESPEVNVVVAHDPRGEVEVRVFRPGTEQGYGWSVHRHGGQGVRQSPLRDRTC